jgi:hypothetical protein
MAPLRSQRKHPKVHLADLPGLLNMGCLLLWEQWAFGTNENESPRASQIMAWTSTLTIVWIFIAT